MSDDYNGWRNWATWNANLWLTNDEPVYKGLYRNRRRLREYFVSWFGEDEHGLSIDSIDLDEVDWQEIRESLEDE